MNWLRRQYLELILFKAWAGLRAESSRNYLTFAWWVFDPILSMGTYYLVFAVLLAADREDYVPFLLIGLVFWQWFMNTVKHGMSSILQGGGLMSQASLPKAIFPSAVITMDTIKFMVVFALLMVFLLFYGYDVGLPWLALPLLLAAQLLLIIGCTFLVAAIVPFLPDLRFLVDALLHLMLFMSGIFYAGDAIPERFREFFYLNPMAYLIDAYRQIFMHNTMPDWEGLVSVFVLAAFLFVTSNWLMTRFERVYPKIVV